MTSLTSHDFCGHQRGDRREASRDRLLRQVEREVQGRQDLPDILNSIEVHGAYLRQVDGLIEDGEQEILVPDARLRVRVEGEQQRLRSARLWLFVVERQTR